ncbi:metallo-dependent hydrolase [Sporomusa acidovorans]|uniref:Deacetylase n=1 Tax=Sporomusa acidovorans (strain ATCC 49682 / DSM 3132 / Mol) TaxID=1123286 RepID=A0ABZ3IXL0_SPOA4|nr:metallo-dependent hydrolase [Sporomusa acidovorans]OZC22349.1 deacetylase [Sporomusa acidovorans DSM 3132]SDE46400.1 Predicted amidohydrolase [Sporomusa acidovorans]
MKCDMLIKGGRVIDPLRAVDTIADIVVKGKKLLPADDLTHYQPELIVDARECIVTPGLIDFHTHVFYRGTENSIAPDVGLLPSGVTTAVDGGSAGSANFEAFYHQVIRTSMVRIIAYLNISSAGQTTVKYDENLDPGCFDSEKIAALFQQYRAVLAGIKIRFTAGIVKNFGLAALEKTLCIASENHCPIMVHPNDPPCTIAELVERLRPGDVFTHVYHGMGNGILDEKGMINRTVTAAKGKGVMFDAANGRSNFAFKTAWPAIKAGFYPDIISSDLTPLNLYRQPAFGLPFLMSKYLAMGMPLVQVVAACTATPARCLHMSDEIGTLAPGACADIAIFRLENRKVKFVDIYGQECMGSMLLVPQMTVKSGNIAYKDFGFGID